MEVRGGGIFVVTHRRSGTHWVIDTIRRNFPRVRPRFFNLDTIAEEGGSAALDRLAARVRRGPGPTLIKSHYPAGLDPIAERPEVREVARDLLDRSRCLCVYRDGRDVLVSLYHYLRRFSPRVKEADFSTFIRQENDFHTPPGGGRQPNRIEYWRSHVERWLERPGTSSISYESMHADYAGAVARLGEELGLGPPRPVLHEVSLPRPGSWGRIRRRIGRSILPRWTSSAVVPRAGRVGDWRVEIPDDDRALIDDVAGELLDRLGYPR